VRIRVGHVTLARRIVFSVALGLAVILVLFGVVAIWTVRDSTQTAYRERVDLAQVFASRADDSMRRSWDSFAGAAGELRLERGKPLTVSQRETLTRSEEVV
jgi:hypothetical protein